MCAKQRKEANNCEIKSFHFIKINNMYSALMIAIALVLKGSHCGKWTNEPIHKANV